MKNQNEIYFPAKASNLEGLFPAIVTPFSREGNRDSCPIDYDTLDTLMERFVDAKVRGVVIAGCTGSASILTPKEHVELVKFAKENYGNKLLIIAGDGSNCTREAKDLAKRIEQETGVSYHLSINPYYNKPSDRGILEHYDAIADSIEGGLILYSVPSRTGGKGILPEVVERLSQHPNIIGIKEASGNMGRMKQLIQRVQSVDFSVLSGNDGEARIAVGLGARGLISTAANVVPREMQTLVEGARFQFRDNPQGKFYEDIPSNFELTCLENCLQPLFESLFPTSESNPSPNSSTTHYALECLGFDVGIPRLPLSELEQEEKESIQEALSEMKDLLNSRSIASYLRV